MRISFSTSPPQYYALSSSGNLNQSCAAAHSLSTKNNSGSKRKCHRNSLEADLHGSATAENPLKHKEKFSLENFSAIERAFPFAYSFASAGATSASTRIISERIRFESSFCA